MSMYLLRPEVRREAKAAPRRRRDPVALACVQCDGDLAWHQPDQAAPDRLLGVCPRCGGWHVMNGDGPGRGALSLIPGTARKPVVRAPRPAKAPVAAASLSDSPPDRPRWRRARLAAAPSMAGGMAVAVAQT